MSGNNTPLAEVVALRVQEAEREPRPRQDQPRPATRGHGTADRWIDRVNQAGLRAAAAAPDPVPPDEPAVTADTETDDIPF
jgi:hypothetical protein